MQEVCGSNPPGRGKGKSIIYIHTCTHVHVYIHIYIYIYIYILPSLWKDMHPAVKGLLSPEHHITTQGIPSAGRNRFDSFRFQFEISSVRFGSENSVSRFDAVRLAFLGRVVARSGSVRFRVRFRPVPELNGSVWFGSAGSIRFLIPSRIRTKILLRVKQTNERRCGKVARVSNKQANP